MLNENTTEKPAGKTFFINLALIALASVLFAVSFPNLLVKNGISIFAWVCFLPVFLLIQRTNITGSVFWGALYGYSSYTLFNYWLGVFHPLASLIVGLIYMAYMAILFPLLKMAVCMFPKRYYLVQLVFWLAYEYIKTLGFLGYSYGIIAYSQWRVLPLIQSAGIFGVWWIGALVVFPSVWLAAALYNFLDIFHNKAQRSQGRQGEKKVLWENISIFLYVFTSLRDAVAKFFRQEKISVIIWGVLLCATFIGGTVSMKNYDTAPKARLALIQHNTDPWRGGIAEYRRNFEILRRLSDEALADVPEPDMVVWSETAFVPRIYWHETYRDDPAAWILVKELLEYLAVQEKPFLIGNDDGRKDPSINPNTSEGYRVDYNAALLFEKGKNTQSYRKVHLVPFTEHFPYKKQFPFIHKALLLADTHFWEKGKEYAVFSVPGFKFSSPICFEDTFGYLSREFVRNGAELIINISNDAWSASLPAQNQHLAMAVFRAVENRRSLARSTASGQTCAIDPSGRIIAMAEPFTEAWLNVDVPITTETALYTRFGDFLGKIFMFLAFGLLILGLILVTIKKVRTENKK